MWKFRYNVVVGTPAPIRARKERGVNSKPPMNSAWIDHQVLNPGGSDKSTTRYPSAPGAAVQNGQPPVRTGVSTRAWHWRQIPTESNCPNGSGGITRGPGSCHPDRKSTPLNPSPPTEV